MMKELSNIYEETHEALQTTWLTLDGLIEAMPDGVSARMWKCDVDGGPMEVG